MGSLGVGPQDPFGVWHAQADDPARLEDATALTEQRTDGLWVVDVFEEVLALDDPRATVREGERLSEIDSEVGLGRNVDVQPPDLAVRAAAEV